MRGISVVIGLALSAFSVLTYAVESGARLIDRVQVQNTSGKGYYYFYNSTGWGAPGCEDSQYSYLSEDDPGAKAMLSLALTAKATQSKVVFQGVCGGTNFFVVNYMTLQ